MNPGELPQTGKMLPHFTLLTPEGSAVRISEFRGRKNLVLIFAAEQSANLLSGLLSREEELADESAVVLVIHAASDCTHGARLTRSGTFRLLCDADAQVSCRFGAEHQPAVYITDQYGEIYSADRASEGAALPDVDEVLASLRHVNAACPE